MSPYYLALLVGGAGFVAYSLWAFTVLPGRERREPEAGREPGRGPRDRSPSRAAPMRVAGGGTRSRGRPGRDREPVPAGADPGAGDGAPAAGAPRPEADAADAARRGRRRGPDRRPPGRARRPPGS